MNKKYKVIALHFTNECNLKCPFCYRSKTRSVKQKDFNFWLDSIKHFSQLTNQIALGGGEPFLFPEFIKSLARKCKQYKIYLNITTNGIILKQFSDRELKELLKDVNMVSISIDNYKLKMWENLEEIKKVIRRIKRYGEVIVGINYLNLDMDFKKIRDTIKFLNPDRTFLLSPKNVPIEDIRKYKGIYLLLTKNHKVFVDDLTKQILTENKLKNWKTPCHYCRGMLSINENGFVFGCSFDSDSKSLLRLKNPKDILKMKNFNDKKRNRYSCPYLMLKKENKNEKTKTT